MKHLFRLLLVFVIIIGFTEVVYSDYTKSTTTGSSGGTPTLTCNSGDTLTSASASWGCVAASNSCPMWSTTSTSATVIISNNFCGGDPCPHVVKSGSFSITCTDPVGCTSTGSEICTGGVDEDCDGSIDCSDSDCSSDSACSTCTPVNGGRSWSCGSWTSCDDSCSSSRSDIYRDCTGTCDNPVPSCGGSGCSGSNTKNEVIDCDDSCFSIGLGQCDDFGWGYSLHGYTDSCQFPEYCCQTDDWESAVCQGFFADPTPPTCGPPPISCGDGSCNGDERCSDGSAVDGAIASNGREYCGVDCGSCKPLETDDGWGSWCDDNCFAIDSASCPGSHPTYCGAGWGAAGQAIYYESMCCKNIDASFNSRPEEIKCGSVSACENNAYVAANDAACLNACQNYCLDTFTKYEYDGCSNGNCLGGKATNCPNGCNNGFCLIDPSSTECQQADFNDDNTVDTDDVFIMFFAITDQSTDSKYDLDGDGGVVDNDDFFILADCYGAAPFCNINECSDSTGDGVVDFDDFFEFSDCFGSTTASDDKCKLFDANQDGEIAYHDLYCFEEDFGSSTGCFAEKTAGLELECGSNGKVCDFNVDPKLHCSYGRESQNTEGYCCTVGESWDDVLRFCVPGADACSCSFTPQVMDFYTDVNCLDGERACVQTDDFSPPGQYWVKITKR